MTSIQEMVESAGIPTIGRTERYENSEKFVGTVFGPTVRSESEFALAFRRACGLGGEAAEEAACQPSSCCGIGCDSDCECL